MSEPVAIHIPRENVNDESARLVAWLVADKTAVQADQPVAEIETSKAVAEVRATAAGILRHARSAGEEIEVGGLIGYVGDGSLPERIAKDETPMPVVQVEALAAPAATLSANQGAGAASATAAPRPTRIGAKAMELIRQHQLDPAAFADRGLVRAQDVLNVLGRAAQPAGGNGAKADAHSNPSVSAPRSTTPAEKSLVNYAQAAGEIRSESLSRSKRIEGRTLWPGVHEALPSVVTVACPTRSLRDASAAHPLLHGQTSPLIVYEAARLLKKYPAFNAFYEADQVHYYQSVNIGVAIDAEHGLKVAVIRDADTKSLETIADEMRERVVQYLQDALPVEALSGGTFTLTDLSGEGVFAFHPLINRAQSAILGVGAEFFAPGGGEGMFNLILAFDHQLAEGRAAAKFLNELKTRLAAYETALSGPRGLAPQSSPDALDVHCSRCMESAAELTALGHYLLQTVDAGGQTRMICSRCVMGYA